MADTDSVAAIREPGYPGGMPASHRHEPVAATAVPPADDLGPKWFGVSIRSLRAKLLLFSLAMVVVSGAVFALLVFAGAHRALESAVGRQLVQTAQDAASDVVDALTEESTNVHTWARQEFMRGMANGDPERHVSRLLASLKESHGRYLDLLCVDANGRAVAASNLALIGTNYAGREWLRSALSGKEVLNSPTRSPEHDRLAVEIAAPIYDPEHPEKIIGALLGLYDWEGQSEVTTRLQRRLRGLGMTVYLLILDERGVVIAAPKKGPLADLAGHNLRAAGWQAAQGQPRQGYGSEPRVRGLVGFARLKSTRPRWSVLAMQPIDETVDSIRSIEKVLAIGMAVVLLGALAVATMLADRMSRPLRELTLATKELARAGEARKPVAVRSQDEIGQLATAFNTMLTELEQAESELLVAGKFAFIGEVAAGVAHEVRTPLGIMRSSAQLLKRSLPPERAETAELAETIVDEVDRLDRVVAGLLQLARPHEPLIEPTPLAPILERALDFVEAQAREKSVTIHRRLTPGQRSAHCDPEQIYQVALNLIVNALQILPAGGEITVRTLPLFNGRVAFEVSDNGPGIPADVRAQIFTPFFTMREGGTGLGLALVQRVVQAHRGAVTVDSTVGRGTTFRVELPSTEET